MKRHTPTLLAGAAARPTWRRIGRPALIRMGTGIVMAALMSQTAQAVSDSWTGSVDGAWATAGNWLSNPGTVPGTGDTATFNAASANTTINLGAGVTISNVMFEAGAAAYTIGAGAPGSQTLSLENAGALGLSPLVSNNQLINANLSLSSAANASATITNSSSALLTVAGGIIANVSSGNGVLHVRGPGNVVLSGPITKPGGGSFALFKRGSGQLTISSNSVWSGTGASSGGFSGPLISQEGTLLFNNGSSNFVNGELVIGGVVANGGAGQNAKIIVDNAKLNVGSWLSVGRGNGIGGVSSDLVFSNSIGTSANISMGYNGNNGANFPKGSLTLNNNSSYTVNGSLFIGENSGADMTLTVNDSSLTNLNTAGIRVSSSGKGTLLINNGNVVTEGDLILNYGTSGETNGAMVVLNGGNLHVAGSTPSSTAERWLIVKRTGNANTELVISNGTLHLNNQTDIRFSTQDGNSTGSNTVSIYNGAIVGYSDRATTVGGDVLIDMQRNGGGATVNTFNLDGGVVTVRGVISTAESGTRIFNFNGGTLRPNANNANFFNLGFGSVSANVRNGGAIIDSNGRDIAIVTPLQHSFIDGDAMIDGGLTKLGAGTLTLPSSSSFNGPVRVSEGTLALDASSGASLYVESLILSNNTSLYINYGGLFGNPGTPVINLNGAVAAGTNITIQINGTGFSIGQFAVIKYTGAPLPNLNNFKLGPLPIGVLGATLVNNPGNSSIDINITGVGQSLVWFGTNSLWDINTTFNWYESSTFNPSKYLEYSGIGDLVRFDDSLDGSLNTNINLTTTLKPANVVVDNAFYDYNFNGAGSLAGSASLVKSNTGSLNLNTVNSYTGGTFIYGGTVNVGTDSNLGDPAGAVTLGGGTLQYTASASVARPMNVVGVSGLGAASGTTLQLNNSFSGTGRLIFDGPGTKLLSNSNRLWFHVIDGTVVLEGDAKYTNNINWTSIAPYYDNLRPSAEARLILRNNAVFDAGNFDFNVSDSTVVGSGDHGRLDIQDNAILRFRNLWVGKGLIATGLVYQTGGIVTNAYNSSADLRIGGNAADQTETFGGYYLSGGRVDLRRLIQVGAYGIGELVITGGEFRNTGAVVVGRFTGSRGTLNISAGLLSAGGDLVIGENGEGTMTISGTGVASASLPLTIGGFATPGTGTVNLNSGGTLIVPQVRMMPVAGSSTFNFNGGTLQASASSAAFIDNLTAANILNGGAIIDSSSNQITIAQALLGAGSGGLTKLGNGTLRLMGANSYTGNTLVNAGSLLMGPAHKTGGNVSVANGATFGAVNSTGTDGAMIGSLTLGTGGATTLDFTYSMTGNPTQAALTAGAITINGNATIRVGGVFSVGAFPILKYSSVSGTFAGLVAPRGVTATLSNDAVNKTYYVVISSVGSGIVWTGNTGLTANLWDIDVTTNWLTGAELTTYQEAVPPGDAVVFTDSGSGTVLLSNTVSPLSVTISNTTVPYTIQGNGQITAVGALRKVGSGTANVNVPATFGGESVISNSTYNIGAAHTFAGLSGNGTIGTSAGSPALTINNATATTFSGRTEGALSLTKTGNGTLTLSGTNSHSGGTRLSGGIVNLTGRIGPTGSITIGHLPTNTVVNISGDVSGTNMYIGNVSGSAAAVYQTGGTVTLNDGEGDVLNVGNWSGSYGYYKASGGTLNVNGISIGGEMNPAGLWPPIGTGDGLMEVDGATINNSGWIVLARGASNQVGVLNVFSGSLTYSGGGIGGNWTTAAGPTDQTTIINILGGSVTSSDQGVNFRSQNTGILNLKGGLLRATAVNGAGSLVNFNGGRLQAAANNGGFLNVDSAYLYAGGGIIDDNGFTITVPQNIQSADGYGVSSIPLIDGGSGYIAPPIVTITGGSGVGATAIATVSGGSVTGITVTSPGSGYTEFDFLTVNFIGGGVGAVPPTVGTITFAPNASGNLVKVGSGTLALNGANMFTGSMVVSNGTLAGIGSLTGPLVVRSGAALAPGENGIGTFSVAATPTFQGSVVMDVDRAGGAPISDLLEAGSAPLVYAGTLVITNVGAEPLQVGDSFKLFNTAGGYSGSFSVVTHSAGQSVTWNTANLTVDGTITVAAVGDAMADYPTNVTVQISGGNMNISWPETHRGWILQTQTNALSVGLSNNWFDVAGSASETNAVIPLNPGNPAVFFRLRHP